LIFENPLFQQVASSYFQISYDSANQWHCDLANQYGGAISANREPASNLELVFQCSHWLRKIAVSHAHRWSQTTRHLSHSWIEGQPKQPLIMRKEKWVH